MTSLQSLSCFDVTNQPGEVTNTEGVTYGEGSRCIEQGRGWSRINVVTGAGASNSQGSGCYEVNLFPVKTMCHRATLE